ncbi:hypothetical protein MCOR25_011264 [Pyricularia grisea]|uniref:Transcription activator GCR1-like domain-containing protein n=1 Tax=Pyricularia grisea TaxID=148305 RepID=A0A6P8AQY5_PYRGI|nr:uncharacterized protein PgNI_12020 [Pyricularia grisea]KAI6352023.1 hypothetical protein MCOR25_011264 [Pyricularia grisea]TLD04453.1 hypothetical protein PgNI_12020 [Pyricularia grisea]
MSCSPSHVAMAEAGFKRTASELDEPASGSEDPESSSALSSHPAKRRYIDQSHAEAQPAVDTGSHTTTASSPITAANGLSNHQQRQFQNGDPSTTHAPPLSGPSTNHLESPGRVQVPEAFDQDRLRGMESGDLIQTILELQSTYEHNMSIISAQYEDVSRQLADIRACLSTLLKGSTASLEAASRCLNASPTTSTTHTISKPVPVTPLPVIPARTDPNTYKPAIQQTKLVPPAPEPTTRRSPPLVSATPLSTPLSASARPTPSPSVDASFQRINTPARVSLKLNFPADGSVPTVVTYSTLHTVGEVWAEFKHGLDGTPPIEVIEQQWGSRWRPDPKGRTWFSRRKIVWDKVRELIHDGLTEEDAVAEVDTMRNGRSVHWLINLLTNDRKEIKASWKAAAAAAKAAKGKR